MIVHLVWLLALVFGLSSFSVFGGQQVGTGTACRPAGPLVRLPGLSEASGLAVSRLTPGRLWTHNDGEPTLFALDTRGAVTARLQLSGATLDDWEAIAVGPCPTGSCLYLADIGDNNAQRKRISIYRVPEPSASVESANLSDVIHATYPDGAHDAETLLVTPNAELFIVTKGDTGPVGLYRFPRDLRTGATVQLERVGKPLGSGKPDAVARITDGSLSADGQWMVLRTRTSLVFYRIADVFAGSWREARRVDLTPLGEPQGEGVALGSNNTVYLAGEGGGQAQGGTFVAFPCTPNP